MYSRVNNNKQSTIIPNKSAMYTWVGFFIRGHSQTTWTR